MTGPAERDLTALAATVEVLTGVVGTHDRRLRKVERTTGRRSATSRRRPVRRPGRPVAGSRQEAVELEPATAAAELADWVDWLRTTYRLTDRLPDHWRDDPMAVAELAALRAAWQAAYTGPEPSFEPVHFHDALARVLDRLGARLASPEPHPAGAELVAWVDWLRGHYALASQIPSDWADEPAMVAELAALRRAWQASHLAGASFEPVHFHDALARVLARIAEWRAARTRRQVTGGALAPGRDG